MKENPLGTVPGAGTVTGVAATSRAPPVPGGALGTPGGAGGGTIANGRKGRTATPVPDAGSWSEVKGTTPREDGSREA